MHAVFGPNAPLTKEYRPWWKKSQKGNKVFFNLMDKYCLDCAERLKLRRKERKRIWSIKVKIIEKIIILMSPYLQQGKRTVLISWLKTALFIISYFGKPTFWLLRNSLCYCRKENRSPRSILIYIFANKDHFHFWRDFESCPIGKKVDWDLLYVKYGIWIQKYTWDFQKCDVSLKLNEMDPF